MRILTWNLWWRFGDWQARQEAIRAVLAELQPDVCGLQEVWADDRSNLAGTIAAELGMHWAWGAARNQVYWQSRLGGTSARHGCAILSRWPLVAPRAEVLSEIHGRTAFGAGIAAPGGRLTFVTAHLSARGGAQFRSRQAQHLGRLVRRWTPPEQAAILTGDFNALPGSEVLSAIGPDFVDVWDAAAGAGPTWMSGDPGSPTTVLDHRIDYVFIRHASQKPSIRSVRIAPSRPVGGLWPSDHAAVLAEVDLC